MPPKRSSAGAPRGRPGDRASINKPPKTTSQSSRGAYSDRNEVDPFADDEPPQRRRKDDMDMDRETGASGQTKADDEDVESKKTIPPELLTRILHEFFEKDGTRISKDANKAVAKYMDIFVREAIARTAVEKGSGFLEVEDLEKIAPQLLMDL
ncbi:CENP-S associating centromere protein X-domain-containing protein [Xylaria palmicola]|nr:CENP-S associating centromere protein X-domain-containing protein [Xylaria palmicola]